MRLVTRGCCLLSALFVAPSLAATLPAPRHHTSHSPHKTQRQVHRKVHRKVRHQTHHRAKHLKPKSAHQWDLQVRHGGKVTLSNLAKGRHHIYVYPHEHPNKAHTWPKRAKPSRRGIYYYSDQHHFADFPPKLLKKFDNFSFVVHPGCVDGLPTPDSTKRVQKELSLRDAIWLALRNNPTVIGSELNRINDKFSLEIAHNAFEPQYNATLTANAITRGQKPTYALATDVSIKSTIGTTVKLGYGQALNGVFGTANLSITQPLLKGFGAVNLLAYKNALDSEQSAKLTFKNSIMTVVDSITTKYRQLVQDEDQMDIQNRTLEQTKAALKRYELQVKVGKMARSDLLQQQATFETTKLSTVKQENQINTSYQNLLKEIGLDPSAKLKVVRKFKFPKFKVPARKQAICWALENNIAYRQQVIAMRAIERTVQTAKNDRKWDLSATASGTVGSTRSGGVNSDASVDPTLGFTLTVPIDRLSTKSSLVAARINLEKAKLALEQAKEDLIRTVSNQLITLQNDQKQIKISEDLLRVQRLNLEATKIKQRYGRTTVFDVTQIQDQLLSQETSMVQTRITYLNDITTLDNLLNFTMKKWGIKLRY